MNSGRKLTATTLGMLAILGMTTSCSSSNRLSIVHFDQTILGDTQKDLGVSIGIKKGNTTLQTALNGVLSGISQETRNTWMTEALERSTSDNVKGSGEIITEATEDKDKFTLTVGLECDYAPFNWTDVTPNSFTYPIDGQTKQYADGYDVTIAKYLAQNLQYNLKIVKLEWDALIPALNNGTINAVIAGMTDTEERRLSIDFTDEYYRSEMVLVVKENSKYATATSLADFANAKIVSQVSTVTDDVISDWAKAYNVNHLNAMDSFAVCAAAVMSGTADAMTAELPVATSIVNGANR